MGSMRELLDLSRLNICLDAKCSMIGAPLRRLSG
jgi:hypothetical protein